VSSSDSVVRSRFVDVQSRDVAVLREIVAEYKAALRRIRHIKDTIPFDAAAAATECISIAKEALGEK
jgi:hypothetical protein